MVVLPTFPSEPCSVLLINFFSYTMFCFPVINNLPHLLVYFLFLLLFHFQTIWKICIFSQYIKMLRYSINFILGGMFLQMWFVLFPSRQCSLGLYQLPSWDFHSLSPCGFPLISLLLDLIIPMSHTFPVLGLLFCFGGTHVPEAISERMLEK